MERLLDGHPFVSMQGSSFSLSDLSPRCIGETQQLELTLLSLHRNSSRPAFPVVQHQISALATPSFLHSGEDLGSMSTTDQEQPTPRQTCAESGPRRRKKTKGIHAGLARLDQAPSPFGSQLGVKSTTSRSRPYQHTHHHDYFNPRPTPRELSVENLEFPHPQLDSLYDTLASAYTSAKNLAHLWASHAVDILTLKQRIWLGQVVVEVALAVCLWYRPRWVLNTLRWSLFVLRQPFWLFRSTLNGYLTMKLLLL